MVDGCTTCEEEQYEDGTKFTYGYADEREPTKITQGGYSTHIVVNNHFAVHIPNNLSFEKAAPLLCAGITTYSPIMKAQINKGDKVAVAGIGGLGQMDYMISTIPYQFDVASYASVVKPYGFFTQVGMPENFQITLNNLGLSVSRVNFNASLIGGMKETQEMINYCAKNNVLPEIQIIKADDINQAWKNVENKKARYRYVIDVATI
jgi:alcohol dehydrogenase (NADP+)/uncharacterized zinc-type alcohol dehydrogenase-like protein